MEKNIKKDYLVSLISWFVFLTIIATIFIVTIIYSLSQNMQILLFSVFFIASLIRIYYEITRTNKRIKRVFLLTLFFSFIPIMFSILMTLSVMVLGKTDNYIPETFHLILMFICMTIPYIFIIRMILVNRSNINIFNDAKVAMNFVTAILTIIFTIQSFAIVQNILKGFLFLLLVPFSINLVVMAIFSYIETNKSLIG